MSERTEHQSSDELQKARALSLEATRPPAQIPGYKLQKFVGSGAYGEVWSATDLKTGRRVAIKFYTRRNHADVQLLAREVEKLAVLSNDRYVVQLLDVGWTANPPYYVMEYIEHGSLEDRLKNGKVLSASHAIELFQNIAIGMMRLHGKGILHCDLKPGNVLLDEDGKPRVADFGQSRLSTDETPALGTLFFMAPEQADMEALPDAGWDVYGLGALLFTMLTGHPPYYSKELAGDIDSTQDISERLSAYRENLTAAPIPTEHRRVPGVDRALADMIDRCIAADPKRRFNNIHSVLLALQQREVVRARRPVMVLGLLGPLMLLGVVTFFGWWAFNQSLSKTSLAVTSKAKESNLFAAKLAARSAAEQIDEYFRVVRQLAANTEFTDAFDELMADDPLKTIRIQLADPRKNGVDQQAADRQLETDREKFKEHPIRKALQRFLEIRLNDPNHEFPSAASWFVCDRMGNQIASAFRTENRTLANNYAFRTYFTGENRDFELDDPKIDWSTDSEAVLARRKIIDAPYLSAVFLSQQTKTWKVAFSAPVIRYGEIQGIVAVTVELGSLVEFENARTQYAMLLDNRPGDNTGVILEHPLFTKILKNENKLPDQFARAIVDIEAAKTVFPFRDPVGDTELGEKYRYGGDSIVSVVPVTMEYSLESHRFPMEGTNVGPSGGGPTGEDRPETGLVILAVQDYQAVLSAVNELGSQLRQLAITAVLLLFGVSVGLWFFVRRMLRESRDRLSRSYTQSAESSFGEGMETMYSAGPLTTPYVTDSEGSRDASSIG